MEQKDNYKVLRDKANEISKILSMHNLEIVEGPNCGNVSCLWLVEKGHPYHTGVYISKNNS